MLVFLVPCQLQFPRVMSGELGKVVLCRGNIGNPVQFQWHVASMVLESSFSQRYDSPHVAGPVASIGDLFTSLGAAPPVLGEEYAKLKDGGETFHPIWVCLFGPFPPPPNAQMVVFLFSL